MVVQSGRFGTAEPLLTGLAEPGDVLSVYPLREEPRFMSIGSASWPRLRQQRLAGAAVVLLTLIGGVRADDSASLEGQVLDADGQPLAGATVTVRAVIDERDPTWWGLEPKGETFDVRASAAGHAFRTLRRITPDGPLSVTLERGTPLVGRVLDAATGEGIAEVRVELSDSRRFDLGDAPFESTTDREGRYHFAHAPQGEIWVRATASGWATRSLQGKVGPVAGEAPESRLDEFWTIEGSRSRASGCSSRPSNARVVEGISDSLRCWRERTQPVTTNSWVSLPVPGIA
jgi:hypothetical protein